MAVIALCSAKGSPGATTTGLACTLRWSSRVVLAECDPAGGSVLAGFLRGQLGADRGLVPLAVAELRAQRLPVDFWQQLVDLDPPRSHRLLLAGVSDPAQAGTLGPVWDRLAALFVSLGAGSPPYDVIADCGRLAVAHPPFPILLAADLILLTVRPTLPSISAAAAALRRLPEQIAGRTGAQVGLVLIGRGAYRATEVSRHLRAPVVVELPFDERSARSLSLGGRLRRGWPLMRAAAAAQRRLIGSLATHRPPLHQAEVADAR